MSIKMLNLGFKKWCATFAKVCEVGDALVRGTYQNEWRRVYTYEDAVGGMLGVLEQTSSVGGMQV